MLLVKNLGGGCSKPEDEFLWEGPIEKLEEELKSRGWKKNSKVSNEWVHKPIIGHKRQYIRIEEVGDPISPNMLVTFLESRRKCYSEKMEIKKAPR